MKSLKIAQEMISRGNTVRVLIIRLFAKAISPHFYTAFGQCDIFRTRNGLAKLCTKKAIIMQNIYLLSSTHFTVGRPNIPQPYAVVVLAVGRLSFCRLKCFI